MNLISITLGIFLVFFFFVFRLGLSPSQMGIGRYLESGPQWRLKLSHSDTGNRYPKQHLNYLGQTLAKAILVFKKMNI